MAPKATRSLQRLLSQWSHMAKALPRPSRAASSHRVPSSIAQKLRGADDAPHASRKANGVRRKRQHGEWQGRTCAARHRHRHRHRRYAPSFASLSLAPCSHAPSCTRRHAFNAPHDSAHTRWMPNELAPSSVPLPCHMPLPCSASPPAVASSSSSERIGPSADRHADDNQRGRIYLLVAPLCQPSYHVGFCEGAGDGAVATSKHVWQGCVPRNPVLPGSRVQRADVGRFLEWPTEVRLPFLLALLPCSYALDAARLLPHLTNDC
ncbi:unnamed protein product [Closterium sp. NIES-54]